MNGLVGLKPSRGRLYKREPAQFEVDISVQLAVSRSVRDTAQILNASEVKGTDAALPPTGFVEGPSKKRLKIAFSTRALTGGDAQADVRSATVARRRCVPIWAMMSKSLPARLSGRNFLITS